jgi:hypothetical protein
VTRPGVNEEGRGRGAGVGGRGRGLQKNDDENFSYCPCPRSSRKGGGRGVFNAAGNRLRKFFVLNERERKFSAAFY